MAGLVCSGTTVAKDEAQPGLHVIRRFSLGFLTQQVRAVAPFLRSEVRVPNDFGYRWDRRFSVELRRCILASIHRVIVAECGASTRKVPLDQGRWELLTLPSPGPKEHLSSAIVA